MLFFAFSPLSIDVKQQKQSLNDAFFHHFFLYHITIYGYLSHFI